MATIRSEIYSTKMGELFWITQGAVITVIADINFGLNRRRWEREGGVGLGLGVLLKYVGLFSHTHTNFSLPRM